MLPVVVRKGTCGSTGAVLFRPASIRTTSKGICSRTSSLTSAQVTLVRRATAGTGRIAIRVGSAATGGIKCGLFTVTAVPPPVAKVTAKITVGSVPSDIAVGGGGVWVTDLVENALFRIDPATNQVAGSVALGAPSTALPMAVAATGEAVWVASNTLAFPGEGRVLRVDPTTMSVVATIPVGSGALDIAAGAGAVWVISAREGTVSRIDPATNSVTATVHVGVNPGGIGVGAAAVWVADNLGAALLRLDQATGQVVATVKLAGPARKVAVSPDAVWLPWPMTQTPRSARLSAWTRRRMRSSPASPSRLIPGVWPRQAPRSGSPRQHVSDAIWINPVTNAIGGRVPLGGDSIGVDVTGSTAWLVGKAPAQVVRIDFAGGTQDPPAATPLVAATPSPAPSPTPSPSAGGTLVVRRTYFKLAIPAGWFSVPSDDSDVLMFSGPWSQQLGATSVGTSLTLEEVSAQVVAGVKSQSGADPGVAEPITMDGVPGRMLTYHFTDMGISVHGLAAFCTHEGRAYEVIFMNAAGAETADRALFLDVVASFGFGPGF